MKSIRSNAVALFVAVMIIALIVKLKQISDMNSQSETFDGAMMPIKQGSAFGKSFQSAFRLAGNAGVVSHHSPV